MSAGPARPRPWLEGEAKTLGQGEVERLTVPLAWQLYSGVIGYHVPRRLSNAELLSFGLRLVR
jgi:hypothetical protein